MLWAVEAIGQWARTVVAVSLMAAVIEMLLPSGVTRAPVRMVIGVLVVLAVASPLVGLFARVPTLTAPSTRPLAISGRPADVVGRQLVARIEHALSTVTGVTRVQARVVMSGDGSLIPSMVRVEMTVAEDVDDGVAKEAVLAIGLLTGLDEDQIQLDVRKR